MPRATAVEEKTPMTVSLARLVRLLHPGKEQGKDHCQRHRHTRWHRHQTAEGANGYAGKGGVPQSVGEEGHASLHHQGGQQSEKGGDDQNGQQGVLHEVHGARLRPLEGQQVDEGVPELHCAPPPFPVCGWKQSRETPARTAPRPAAPSCSTCLLEQDHLVRILLQRWRSRGWRAGWTGHTWCGISSSSVQQLALPLHIHTGERLVQDQDVGHRLQRHGQQHPLQLAAGQRAHALVQQLARRAPGSRQRSDTVPAAPWGWADTPASWRWTRRTEVQHAHRVARGQSWGSGAHSRCGGASGCRRRSGIGWSRYRIPALGWSGKGNFFRRRWGQ